MGVVREQPSPFRPSPFLVCFATFELALRSVEPIGRNVVVSLVNTSLATCRAAASSRRKQRFSGTFLSSPSVTTRTLRKTSDSIADCGFARTGSAARRPRRPTATYPRPTGGHDEVVRSKSAHHRTRPTAYPALPSFSTPFLPRCSSSSESDVAMAQRSDGPSLSCQQPAATARLRPR